MRHGRDPVALPGPTADQGVYGISVAADLVGMGMQTLRLYETRGLLEPNRTDGGTRRYSANDLDRLRRIGDLVDAGLNLAGVGMVLDLEAENAQLRTDSKKRERRQRPHGDPSGRPPKRRPPKTKTPSPTVDEG